MFKYCNFEWVDKDFLFPPTPAKKKSGSSLNKKNYKKLTCSYSACLEVQLPEIFQLVYQTLHTPY